MESIGEKLRQTRESRGYTIEQIARDTHIARRFIEALEAEDFGVFPGDPYLIGFMRTYSEYLSLDPEEIVSLYRNLKLQEQPAPIDELISKRSRGGPGLVIGIVAVAAVLLGAGAYFLFSSGVFARDNDGPEEPVPEPVEGTTFQLSGEWVEQRFAQGDRIVVPVGESEFAIDLVSITDSLVLRTDLGDVDVPVNEERPIDLDADSNPDVRVILRSTDTLDSPPTVVMRVNRGASTAAASTESDANLIPGDPPPGSSPVIGSTTDPRRVQDSIAIAEFAQREEFFVEVRFEGYTLFRYQVDTDPRVEQYFQQGQTLRTSVVDQFRLWVSNAGAVRLRVAGQDLGLGPSGRVTAALISWMDVPNSNNVRLELIPVY
jgi:cytoskeletal protein RodZ